MTNKGLVTTIPDAMTSTKIVEIKDTKNLYNTKQIQAQSRAATIGGYSYEIYV